MVTMAQFCSAPGDSVHTELVTGKVFTAPEDILDSRPGTLMLTDCIDLCLANSTCRSANFETGLCVLFSSSAQQYPGINGHDSRNQNTYLCDMYDISASW